MPPDQNRRASDNRAHNIEDMIAEENDPKQRAFLIVLNAINQSLLANTRTIRDISEKLDDHLTNFEEHAAEDAAMQNKGKGAWKVAAWVLGAAQIAGLATWTTVSSDLKSIHETLQAGQVTDARIEARVLNIEKNDIHVTHPKGTP